MTFLSTLITYVLIFLGSMILAFAAVMIGKKLRDAKNKKMPVETLEQKKE
ncbi:MAG: vanadium nitrogenase [Lachnospiraceae bacterium]|nr:vanadium nitrogenase [Lachnospiraceae bacterium]